MDFIICVFLHPPGEVFVLDDGGEVDLDLGNYERFLDVTLHRDNNITTGKIYQSVIERERKGDYLGKTVQGEKTINFARFFRCWWLYIILFALWSGYLTNNHC